jgi:hypothetical protein
MDARSTSEAPRVGESSDASSALLDRALFEPHLVPGEKILWVGRPARIHFMAQGDWRLLLTDFARLVGIAALGLIVFSAASFFQQHHLPPYDRVIRSVVFIGGMFFLLFVFVVLMRAIRNIFRILTLRRSSFLLTDRRAFCLDRGKPGDPAHVDLATVDRFHQEERPDGSGSVVFGYRKEKRKMKYSTVTVDVPRLMFEDIGGVSLVRKLAEDAAEKLTLHPTPLSP